MTDPRKGAHRESAGTTGTTGTTLKTLDILGPRCARGPGTTGTTAHDRTASGLACAMGGPRGPRLPQAGGTTEAQQHQRGPHGPHGPCPDDGEPRDHEPPTDLVALMRSLFQAPAASPTAPAEPPTAALADPLDAAEERAAIMEHDGGVPRAEAEALALGAASPQPLAIPSPIASDATPAEAEGDARELMALLEAEGPHTYGAAASALGWGATRAALAKGALKEAGRIGFDAIARMVPRGTEP